MEYIDIVQEKVKLREGKKCIEKILVDLFLEEHMSTKELARRGFLPIPVVTAIKKELIELGLVVQENGIRISDKGKKYVEGNLGYKGLDVEKYKKLKECSEYQDALIGQLSERYREIYENRPVANVQVDQAKATIETAFKRAVLAFINDCLIQKKILCIGDDDLVSISVGLLLKELYPEVSDIGSEIIALDIDERIVNYINLISQEQRIPVEAIKVDFCDPLPINYASHCDTFFTDPPYTEEGVKLFLSRGVSALKKERGLKIFLSFGQKPINETLDIQKIILNHGLTINNIMKGYNIYEGAGLLGNMSQMMMLESTDYMRNVVLSAEKYSKEIYTADFRNHTARYECKFCKRIFKVGKNEAICTIEELKKRKCDFCGGDSFTLMKNRKKPDIDSKGSIITLGKHILADFYDCKQEMLCDERQIHKIMHDAAEIANATVVEENFHKFSPWGVSGAIIIQESHLTIHTWPEYNYAAVDVFTCGETLELWKALEYLKEHLGCQDMQYSDIGRGIFSQNGEKCSDRRTEKFELGARNEEY